MSEQAELYSLRKLAETGDSASAEKLASLLLKDPEIEARHDHAGVADAILSTVDAINREGASPEEALSALRESLRDVPDTVLLALFATARTSAELCYGRIRYGPASAMVGELGAEHPAALSPFMESDRLVIRVDEPSQGAKGRRAAFQWLRAALGALYLSARASGVASAPIGPVPADELAPSLYIGAGPASGLVCLVEAMREPAQGDFDLDDLAAAPGALAVLADCLNPSPATLVEKRLQAATPWIEVGFDALSHADAVLALGIALECLIGSESTDDAVVKLVSNRAGFLLRKGRSRRERALTNGTWRDKTRRLYDARSKVAHGRSADSPQPEAEERATRDEFEDLVCRVAEAFRAIGKAKRWENDSDLRRWHEALEMG